MTDQKIRSFGQVLRDVSSEIGCRTGRITVNWRSVNSQQQRADRRGRRFRSVSSSWEWPIRMQIPTQHTNDEVCRADVVKQVHAQCQIPAQKRADRR